MSSGVEPRMAYDIDALLSSELPLCCLCLADGWHAGDRFEFPIISLARKVRTLVLPACSWAHCWHFFLRHSFVSQDSPAVHQAIGRDVCTRLRCTQDKFFILCKHSYCPSPW